MNRLNPFRDRFVSIGNVYGVPAYGSIGVIPPPNPGTPQFVTDLMEEISDDIPAAVSTYGMVAYGKLLARSPVQAPPVLRFRLLTEGARSFEFVEDETILPVLLRVMPNGSAIAYEWVEE